MPRKGQSHPGKKTYGNLADADGFAAHLVRYGEWLGVTNYSPKTMESRVLYIQYFMAWCEERGLTQPREITRAIIERYQRHLYHYRKENGEPLSFRSQHGRLTALRAYFKWLAKQNYILYNPAAEIELPKLEKRLPKHVLSQDEMETVLAQPDLADPLGLRDRAMLETFYSTGIRRMELINLRLYDLDAERGTLMVRLGKGRKDRMVPIGERAIAWITKYLNDVRPALALTPEEEHLFLTNLGESFTPTRLTQIVRRHVLQANTGKAGSCHLFRHTMATLMLEGGADIRFIQEMLGHARVDTTQIYTQVSIRKLKEIHTATHPARLTRKNEARTLDDYAALADELLAELEAEAEDEGELEA